MYKPQWYLSFLDLTLRQDSTELGRLSNAYSWVWYETLQRTFSLGVNTRIRGQGGKIKIRRLPFSKPLISVHGPKRREQGWWILVLYTLFHKLQFKVLRNGLIWTDTFKANKLTLNKIILNLLRIFKWQIWVFDLLYWLQSQHHVSPLHQFAKKENTTSLCQEGKVSVQ